MTDLCERNAMWLRQSLHLLEMLDDRTFKNLAYRVSGHLRHIIEFYECFLEGLAARHIDYDARRRDRALESSRLAAAMRVRSLIERLQSLQSDGPLLVRAEDAEPYLSSSIGRELQSLSSHTVHHFALIAMSLRAMGIPVDEDFGVAPSTLRYRQAA